MSHPGRESRLRVWPLRAPVAIAVVVALAVLLVWAAWPDAQPVVLLFGFAADAVLLGVLYVVERRRHW